MVALTRDERRKHVLESTQSGYGYEGDIKATAHVVYRHSKNTEGRR